MHGRRSLKDERGFTLIEVLVVMVIIGVLAAIALPQFAGHKARAQDSEAKMAAGTMHAHVESCFVETEDYRDCEPGDAPLGDTRMPIGTGPGQISVDARGPRGYSIAARSNSGTTFFLEKAGGGAPTRRCDRDAGGCRGGEW